MKPLIVFSFFTFLIFIAIATAHAQTVTSFTATPASIRSGGFIDFVWQLQSAGGYSFLITTCTPGIKLKYSSGSTLTCGSKVSSTLTTNDYITLFIYNISGGTVSATARIIPKDGTGQDQDAAARDVTISVKNDPQPITDFTTNATSTSASQPVAISWQSSALDGVNLQIECRPEIKVSSPDYTTGFYLPCGTPVFLQDLSPNSLSR